MYIQFLYLQFKICWTDISEKREIIDESFSDW